MKKKKKTAVEKVVKKVKKALDYKPYDKKKKK
jgi:hypothetical protein